MDGTITARAVFQAHVDGMTATGLADLSLPISTAWWFDDSGAQFDIIDFAPGATRLQRPTRATMLIVIPPPTNVIIPTVQGTFGDAVGVALSPNSASVLALARGSQVLLVWPAAIAGVRIIWL